jgi:hypothetical protein
MSTEKTDLNNLVSMFYELDDTIKNSPIVQLISTGIDFIKTLDEYGVADDDNDTEEASSSRVIEIEDDFDEPDRHILPSEKLDDVDKKLEIHKIVQEYVDSEIRPYVEDNMTQEQISDAYSALYEFACWIMNK